MNTRSLLLSALIAGAVLGLLGNLPVLNFINIFLCMWVWLGGIFAVYLYNRYERNRTQLAQASASIGQGAAVGALAGVVGAFVGVVVFALTSFITAPMMEALAKALQMNDFPVGTSIAEVAIFFCLDIFLYPLFGAIGGLLAAGVFWKKPLAPAA